MAHLESLNELALFAGAGGGLLGSKLLGWRTVCAVEIDPYCRRVLMQRQNDGVLEPFPIWDDVRTFDGTAWNGIVDVVSAGFPCQPFSSTGVRRAESDERNLWPDTARVLREVRPPNAFLENVPALVRYDYFGVILGDLAAMGFDAEWGIVSAASLGAPHLRERLWIYCHSNGYGQSTLSINDETSGVSSHVADSSAIRCEGSDRWTRLATPKRQSRTRSTLELGGFSGWNSTPELQRMPDGMANGLDRIRAIGNGQVPAVVRAAWKLLSGDQT